MGPDAPRRQPRSAGRPPLGQPCTLAPCLHRPRPLPTDREGHDFPGTCTRRHNSFRDSAFPAPNNLWETRLPIKQTFIQVVHQVPPPLFPVEVIVIVDALEVVLCFVPGFGNAHSQAGSYLVVQCGYELLVDDYSFRQTGDSVPSSLRTLLSNWSRKVTCGPAAQHTPSPVKRAALGRRSKTTLHTAVAAKEVVLGPPPRRA